MVKYILVILLGIINACCEGQAKEEFVLIRAGNDRSELASLVRFLKDHNPKLICINADLFRCDNEQPPDLFQSHKGRLDSGEILTPSNAEKQLSRELRTAKSLLLPSRIRDFGGYGNVEISGCGFFYNEEVMTGYVDFVNGRDLPIRIEKFQPSFEDSDGVISYHFSVRIALALDSAKARKYLDSHRGPIKIDFSQAPRFVSFSYEELTKKMTDWEVLKGKIVIIGTQEEPVPVQGATGDDTLIQMSTSEIFAKIVYQIIGN